MRRLLVLANCGYVGDILAFVPFFQALQQRLADIGSLTMPQQKFDLPQKRKHLRHGHPELGSAKYPQSIFLLKEHLA
jgi:hypothetical protein